MVGTRKNRMNKSISSRSSSSSSSRSSATSRTRNTEQEDTQVEEEDDNLPDGQTTGAIFNDSDDESTIDGRRLLNLVTLQNGAESRGTDPITAITEDSQLQEIDMSAEEKKRKLEKLYAISNANDKIEEDEYEIANIRKVVRNDIFPMVKFCKGEGNTQRIVQPGPSRNGKRLKKLLEVGKTHEFADLTKKSGFEYQVLKLCGMDEGKKTLTQRANWWKKYSHYVKMEIRQQRGNIQYWIRKNMTEGEINCINL